MPLLLLFAVSGAPGLVAQVTWVRVFAASLGHELPALLGVVSAFFAGLAAGAWLLDPLVARSPRPGRWYAGCEAFSAVWIGVGTLLLPWAESIAWRGNGLEISTGLRMAVAFGVPLLVAGPAAAAMGATLAAMDRAVAPRVRDGRAVAALYALNTAGAVAGVVAAVAWVMPVFGLRGTLGLAAATQALCAVVGWSLAVPVESIPPPSEPAGERRFATPFLTGLLGIGYELLGIRVLAQTTENTVHTFAAVLAVYLAGTAAGAAGLRRWPSRGRAISEVTLLRALAVAVLMEIPVMAASGSLLGILRRVAWPGWVAEALLAFAIFGVPTLLMGALFAVVVQSARGGDGGVGRAVASNALGGALAGPMVLLGLLPGLGLRAAVMALGVGYGAWSLLRIRPGTRPSAAPVATKGESPRLRAVGAGAWVGALAVAGLVPFHLIELPAGTSVVWRHEGFLATVAVVRGADGHRTLRVNNHFQQGGTATASAARRHAHLPLLLHPSPRRALFLGVGTGVTLGAVTDHPGLVADGVELLPEVIAALPEFEPENRGPQHHPGIRVIGADARRFARVATNTYDVIVADLFHPSEDGAGFLYTREHFAALRERLAPGGLACQWLPLHQLDRRCFDDITRTFREVFPDATLWLLRFNVDVPVVGLIGHREAEGRLGVDPEALRRRWENPALAEALRPLAWTDPVRILGGFLADSATLARLTARGEVATDDRPSVLFRAAGVAYRKDPRPDRLLIELLTDIGPTPGFDAVLPAGVTGRETLRSQLEAFVRARDLHLRGLSIAAGGEIRGATEWYLRSAGESAEYTAGYAQAVMVASAYAREDPAFARGLLERLVRIRPEQKLAGEVLRRLTVSP